MDKAEKMRTTELIIESGNHFKLGDYEKAIQKLNHALIIEPENVDAKKLLLEIYIHQDETEQALNIIGELLENDTEDIELLYLKANCLNDSGELDEALNLYNSVISKKADFYLAYGARGTVYLKLGQNDKAIRDLDYSLKHEKKNAILLSQRALIHIENQNFKLALSDLNMALRIDKDLKEARLNRAFIYRVLGEESKALNEIEKIDDGLQLDSESNHQKGIIYYKNNDLIKALANYNLAIEKDPNNIESIYSRALLYCKLEQFDNAINDLDLAMELDNSHFLDHLLNGYAYIYFKMREFKKAIDYAEKTLKENKEFFWANLTLAEIYGETEEYDKFYENLKIAIRGGIGIEDIDETIRRKYSNDKEFKKLTKKLK